MELSILSQEFRSRNLSAPRIHSDFIGSILAVVLVLSSAPPTFAQDVCTAGQYDRTFFNALKETDFMPKESIRDDALAILLATCLGDPDTILRDGIAFEGLTALLRRGRVSHGGARMLLDKCTQYLNSDQDGEGFLKPFAALCVAEVARTDRVEAYLSPEERAAIVETGTNYLKSITDYRGFDEQEGWRHGIAHTADVFMQLTLNDNVGVEAHRKMLGAIKTQVAPKEHFYIYGEPQRLARPVLFIAMRGTIKEEEWINWFKEVAKSGPELNAWNEAFGSQAGLAKRHNINAFLSELYLNASTSDNENLKAILPSVTAALRELP